MANRQNLNAAIAQVQADIPRLSKYLRSSLGFLAELVGNETNTATEALAPFVKFLGAVKTAATSAKDKEEYYSIIGNAEWMTFETIEMFENYVTLLDTKWTNRFGTSNKNLISLQSLTGELHDDLDMSMFQDAKMFRALQYYVEALAFADLVTDAATWVAPITTLVTEIKTLVDGWDSAGQVKVTTPMTDTINPYTITAALEAATGTITASAAYAISVRDGEDVVVAPTGACNVDGSCTGGSSTGTESSALECTTAGGTWTEPSCSETTEAACATGTWTSGGTCSAKSTEKSAKKAEKQAKKAAEEAAIEAAVEEIKAEEITVE